MTLDVAIEHQRQQVEHAMLAVEMLGLANRIQGGYGFSPLIPLLVTARDEDKRILFRVHLDQYQPFVLFVERLRAGSQPQQAATQVCAVFEFADDPVVAWRAFESWGTYTGSLVRGEGGRYAPAASLGKLDVLRQSLSGLFEQGQDARQLIHEHLGQEAFEFVEGRIRDGLADAIVMLANGNEPASVELLLSNTYEDFLRRVGYRRVNLQNANGIMQIGDRLRGRRLVSQKHLGAIHLVGHIRNAAEHGPDPDEGDKPWQITVSTVHLMILAILSSIRSIALYRTREILEL